METRSGYGKAMALLLRSTLVAFVAMTAADQAWAVYTEMNVWVFKEPFKNPVRPEGFAGYWLPVPYDCEKRGNNKGTPYTDAELTIPGTNIVYGSYRDGAGKGPLFDPGVHDGIDLVAWVDNSCVVHLFSTTDVVYPTCAGTATEGWGQGNQGGRVEHRGGSYEQYGHVSTTGDITGPVGTDTKLGTLYGFTDGTLVHLHYGVFGDPGNGGDYCFLDPLSTQMEMKTVPCRPTPEPASVVLTGSGLIGFAGLARRRRAA